MTASAPAPASGRRLADVVIGIAAETTDVASVEDDRAVPSLDSATRATEFRVRALANERTHRPSVSSEPSGSALESTATSSLRCSPRQDEATFASINRSSGPSRRRSAARRARPVRKLPRSDREHASKSNQRASAAFHGQRKLRGPHANPRRRGCVPRQTRHGGDARDCRRADGNEPEPGARFPTGVRLARRARHLTAPFRALVRRRACGRPRRDAAHHRRAPRPHVRAHMDSRRHRLHAHRLRQRPTPSPWPTRHDDLGYVHCKRVARHPRSRTTQGVRR